MRALAAFLLGLAVLLPFLTTPRLQGEEGRRGLVGREMAARGEWVVPTVAGEMHLNKPPAGGWSRAAAVALLADHRGGQVWDVFALRLPSVLAAALLCGLIVLLARGSVDPRTAGIAGVMLAGTVLLLEKGARGVVDAEFSLGIGCVLVALPRILSAERAPLGAMLGSAIGLAWGLLTEGLLATLFVGAALLPLLVMGRCTASGVARTGVVLLGGSVPYLVWWRLTGQALGGFDALGEATMSETLNQLPAWDTDAVLRALSMPLVLLVATLPWSPFLVRAWRQRKALPGSVRDLGWCVAGPLVVLGAVTGGEAGHLLPLTAPAAVLAAAAASTCDYRRRAGGLGRYVIRVLQVGLVLGASVGLTGLAIRMIDGAQWFADTGLELAGSPRPDVATDLAWCGLALVVTAFLGFRAYSKQSWGMVFAALTLVTGAGSAAVRAGREVMPAWQKIHARDVAEVLVEVRAHEAPDADWRWADVPDGWNRVFVLLDDVMAPLQAGEDDVILVAPVGWARQQAASRPARILGTVDYAGVLAEVVDLRPRSR